MFLLERKATTPQHYGGLFVGLIYLIFGLAECCRGGGGIFFKKISDQRRNPPKERDIFGFLFRCSTAGQVGPDHITSPCGKRYFTTYTAYTSRGGVKEQHPKGINEVPIKEDFRNGCPKRHWTVDLILRGNTQPIRAGQSADTAIPPRCETDYGFSGSSGSGLPCALLVFYLPHTQPDPATGMCACVHRSAVRSLALQYALSFSLAEDRVLLCVCSCAFDSFTS